MTTDQLCGSLYPSRSRQPNTRIVHCDLPAGHDGDHMEQDTESTWPRAEPVTPTPAEPRGIVTCDETDHPHTRDGNCTNPVPAVHTPGAGVELLRRERPGMVPDLDDEDFAAADRLIAAAERRLADPKAAEAGLATGGDLAAHLPLTAEDNPPGFVMPKTVAFIKELERAAYERGKAEGHVLGHQDGWREATEGWEREWLVNHPPYGGADTFVTEGLAREEAARVGRPVFVRLVGPWEPAEQPEPARGVGWRLARDEEIQDAAHMAAMEQRMEHEAEQPEGSDR